jgi:type VI secretion system protein ImpC
MDAQYARVRLDVDPRGRGTPPVPQPDDPFCIALLGDFSGRASAGPPLVDRRAIPIDRDDLDDRLASLAPELRIDLGGGIAGRFAFRSLDEFHPDRLWASAPLFRALREAHAHREESASADPPEPAAPLPAPESLLRGSILDRMLDASSTTTSPAPADPLEAYVHRIVAPHLVPDEDSHQAARRQEIESIATAALRATLHDPAFQALEARWRGADFVVKRLDTDASLRVFLLDVSYADIAADAAVDGSAFATLLDRTAQALPGNAGWCVLAADWSFAPGDARTLGHSARAAARYGAAFLAAADPALAGIASFATLPDAARETGDPDWHALRRQHDAHHAGLALPRILLRTPYGQHADPCDTIPFEEMTPTPNHRDFLWGSPAFACAVLLGQSFQEAGWRMRPGMRLDLDRLPLHTYTHDGETTLLPCAESLMTDRLAGQLLDCGLMPLASIRHGDTARLVRFQSIASPLTALRGPWDRRS